MVDKTINSYKNFINGLTESELSLFVKLKRFFESYQGNKSFREAVDNAVGLEELNISFDDKSITLNDLVSIINPKEKNKKSVVMNIWAKYLTSASEFRKEILNLGNSNGRYMAFDDWRDKQIRRTAFELGVKGTGIVHSPLAIELSDGCSVGCWFCGISAEKFKGHYSLKEKGEKEWRQTLEALHSVLGEGMKAGFCYWGTDPLDNPEYLEFIKIYHEIVGAIPQTTSAIPLKNIELTKAVLEYSNHHRDTPNRFSILSTSVLDRVHKTFTPEELLGVELVLQNVGAKLETKSGAGRALVRDSDKVFFSDSKKRKFDTVQSDSTIACVSGFLLNIVKKNIKLISPTVANSTWKDGFIIFDEANYNHPDELPHIINKMVEKQLYGQIKQDLEFSLHENIKIKKGCISSPNVQIEAPFSEKLTDIISRGGITPLNVVCNLSNQGEDPREVIKFLNFLWNNGFIKQNYLNEA